MPKKSEPKKAPPLTPVFDEGRGKWRLSVPANFSPSGKRQRLFFNTSREADMEADRLKKMRARFGSEGKLLKADTATDAAKARAILEEAGIDTTLTAIAKAHVEAVRLRQQSVSFREAWQVFRESREAMSDEHQRALDRIGGKLLSEIGSVNLRDLTANQLERALSKHFKGAHAFNLARRSVSPCFTMAVKRDPAWMDKNPCQSIEKRDTGRKGAVAVLSVEQCRQMIRACRDWREDKDTHANWQVDASDALPALVLQMFAGIRPYEITRLDWEDVDLESGTIFISNQKAKVDRSREIEMPETLKAWLADCAPPEPRTGPVIPANWKRKAQLLRMKADAGKDRDQLRKSFASYHLRMYGDANATRAILGHETDELLFTNYRNAVRLKDAKQFWQILPGNQTGLKALTA
jgi:integrase